VIPLRPDRISLDGQFALVTGAASSIGRACALALARAGAGVALNYCAHSWPAARSVTEEIQDLGGRAVALAADISRPDEVERMYSEVLRAFGALHILVNNAGMQETSFEQIPVEQWSRALDANLTGQFLCAQQAVRLFELRAGTARNRDGGALGKIVCLSSVHQPIPWAGHANRASEKAGVRLLMETLAQELGPRKIRVNAVAPGAIRTVDGGSVWEDEGNRRQLLTLIPYGRVGTPEDVARAVLWLASDESDYVTGSILTVDGGMMLYPVFRDQ
jgi:glucose 1-dehydrogenase